MTYTATITSTGQITIPKPIRDILNTKPGSRLTIDIEGDAVTIKRQKSLRESLAELDEQNAILETPASLAARKKYRGMTATEMRNAWDSSPEGIAYYKEKYGI